MPARRALAALLSVRSVLSVLSVLYGLLLSSSTAAHAACVPSSALAGGCQLHSPRGTAVHYALSGGDVTFEVSGDTSGFVAIWVTPQNQTSPYPGDGVVGAAHPDGYTPWSVVTVQLNGPRLTDVLESGVPLTNSSAVTRPNGWTTLRFTRPLGAGRFPINANAVRLVLATGSTDAGMSFNGTAGVIEANLFLGTPSALPGPPALPAPPALPPSAPATVPMDTTAPPPPASAASREGVVSFVSVLLCLALA